MNRRRTKSLQGLQAPIRKPGNASRSSTSDTDLLLGCYRELSAILIRTSATIPQPNPQQALGGLTDAPRQAGVGYSGGKYMFEIPPCVPWNPAENTWLHTEWGTVSKRRGNTENKKFNSSHSDIKSSHGLFTSNPRVCRIYIWIIFSETPVWLECIILLLLSFVFIFHWSKPGWKSWLLCIWLFWAPSCNQSMVYKQKSHGLPNSGALWLVRVLATVHNCWSLTFWQKTQNMIPFLLKEASVSSHLSVVASIQNSLFATKQRPSMTELFNLLIRTSIKRG